MPDNFSQTVDLKKKMQSARKENGGIFDLENRQTAGKSPAPKSRAQDIDQVFGDEAGSSGELTRISRPKPGRHATLRSARRLIMAGLALALLFGAYLFFSGRGAEKPDARTVQSGTGWYAVKLVNNEVYFGQIENTSADPIVIKSVYYNYDQTNGEEAKPEEGGSLRLVKRGKETHGPDGTLSVVRTQVLFMEPLKEDSKVLRAILDYEK